MSKNHIEKYRKISKKKSAKNQQNARILHDPCPKN